MKLLYFLIFTISLTSCFNSNDKKTLTILEEKGQTKRTVASEIMSVGQLGFSFEEDSDSTYPIAAKEERCDGKGDWHINILQDGTEEKGGFVEETAFVGDEVWLDRNSSVCDYASVEDQVQIRGEVRIKDNATILGKVEFNGGALVGDYATISQSARIFGKNIHINGNAIVKGTTQVSNGVKIGENAFVAGYSYVKKDSILMGYDNKNGSYTDSGPNSILRKEVEKDIIETILPKEKEYVGPMIEKDSSCQSSQNKSFDFGQRKKELEEELEKDQFGYSFEQIKAEGSSWDFDNSNLNKIETCKQAYYEGYINAKKNCESGGGISSKGLQEMDCTCEIKRRGIDDDFFCQAKGIVKCRAGRNLSFEDQTKLNILKGMADAVLESFNIQNVGELSIRAFGLKNNLSVTELPSTKIIEYFAGFRSLSNQAKQLKTIIENQVSSGKTGDLIMLQMDQLKGELEDQLNCLKNTREEMPKISGKLPNIPKI